MALLMAIETLPVLILALILVLAISLQTTPYAYELRARSNTDLLRRAVLPP